MRRFLLSIQHSPTSQNLKTHCSYLEPHPAGVAELGVAGESYIKHMWPSLRCVIHSGQRDQRKFLQDHQFPPSGPPLGPDFAFPLLLVDLPVIPALGVWEMDSSGSGHPLRG